MSPLSYSSSTSRDIRRSQLLCTMLPSDSECDVLSAYPPSTPSLSESESDFDIGSTSLTLKAALFALSESRLRALLQKLADSNPRIQNVIVKELSDSSPTKDASLPIVSPIVSTSKSQRRHRTRRRRGSTMTRPRSLSVRCADCGQRPETAIACESDNNECIYHPGVLDKKKFDCFSASASGQAIWSTQIYTMWSCCYEDETIPGCVSAPSHNFPSYPRPPEKTVPPGL